MIHRRDDGIGIVGAADRAFYQSSAPVYAPTPEPWFAQLYAEPPPIVVIAPEPEEPEPMLPLQQLRNFVGYDPPPIDPALVYLETSSLGVTDPDDPARQKKLAAYQAPVPAPAAPAAPQAPVVTFTGLEAGAAPGLDYEALCGAMPGSMVPECVAIRARQAAARPQLPHLPAPPFVPTPTSSTTAKTATPRSAPPLHPSLGAWGLLGIHR